MKTVKVKPFNTIVYIGRFQPFHNGHKAVIDKALELAQSVIVLIGSANEPRTIKNPFTWQERAWMIRETYGDVHLDCFPIETNLYNDQSWVVQVQSIIDQYSITEEGIPIGIIGHKKDESSYYLNMFPQWEFIEVPLVEPLDATQIRNMYFSSNCNRNWFKGVIPSGTDKFFDLFPTNEYTQLRKEKEFIDNYKKKFANLPYEPVFTTVDAVVFYAGHVLMIERKAEPGKGLLAFPGGFLNAKSDVTLEDAMIRELKEETNIKVPEKILRGSIKANKVFAHPERSLRGRTITHAFNIVLDDPPDSKMPKVKGADDAAKARWIPISQINRNECFEDHFCILEHFLGR